MNDPNLITADDICQAIDQEDTVKLEEYYCKCPDLFAAFAFSAAQQNALHYAAYSGKLKACKCLLSLGMDIDSETVRWRTPLCEAANQGHRHVVEYLVQSRCTVDGTVNTIATPLMGAITFKHTEIARFLIDHGADINRLHLMKHQTPLDLSRIWKLPEIEQLLLEKGAQGKLFPSDMNGFSGAGILLHTSKIGSVLPIVLKDDGHIQLRLAVINKGKQKMLFTLGLFADTNPKMEFNIILPVEWNMYDTCPENQFPVELLWSLAMEVQNGIQVDEHYFISADKEPYNHLSWPDNTAGFHPADVDWGLKQADTGADTEYENPVQLLSLLPIKRTKKLSAPDLEKNRAAKWGKLTLKLPHKL